jgi:5-methylcytosine-specific restriction endonuclease McrA
MDLKHKTNKQIEAEVKRIVNSEFCSVIDGVLYLCEIVRRNIHVAGPHPSLYSYLMGMGFSRDQALVRKDAVLLLVELPELKYLFMDRKLCISSLHYMRQTFRREQRRRRKEKLEPLTRERKLEVARKISRESSRQTRRTLAEEFPECHGSKESTRPVAGGLTEIKFCCTDPELQNFEELKDLWGHKNHERSWQVLFADMAFDALKRWREGMAKSINLDKVGTPRKMSYEKARKRYRSVHVERLVWNRAGHRCEHVDPETGERCSSTHALQTDHIVPLARGGLDHPDNMRLLCGPHNRYAAWNVGLRRPEAELDH